VGAAAHHADFTVSLDEVEVIVADLGDVIRSKESAGRPQALRVLPLLCRHQSTRQGMDD
jgi:hypothetical protein